MKRLRSVAARMLIASGVVWIGLASQPGHVRAAEAAGQQEVTASATGEVRRVDAAAGKVALKHDAIAALELPAMTLVYQATPVLLIDIEPGDRVRFTAARRNGTYIVTEISK